MNRFDYKWNLCEVTSIRADKQDVEDLADSRKNFTSPLLVLQFSFYSRVFCSLSHVFCVTELPKATKLGKLVFFASN